MFIIQQNLINQEHVKNIKSIIDNKYPITYVDLVPFSLTDTNPNIEELNKYKDTAIPYGSSNLTKIAYANKWKGCYYNEKLKYNVFCEHRNDMFNISDLCFDVIKLSKWIKILIETEKELGKKKWFIKPNDDDKLFTGYCDYLENILEWLTDIIDNNETEGSYYFPLETKLILSLERNIDGEMRFFIVNGKVITGSVYKKHSDIFQEEVSKKDLIQAQNMADVWIPHRNCVMDIAIRHDIWYVLEFNCINSSGFYSGHDIDLVFKKLYNDFKLNQH